MTDKPRVRATNDGLVPVNDNLTNLVSGLGTRSDKRFHNHFGYGTPAVNWVELEGAYTDNWIARKIVQIPVDDGLREWRSFQCEEAADIEAEEKRLNLIQNYKLARYWARLYGGSVILMITDQPLDQPLDYGKIKQGSLKRLVVLDRWDIWPQHMNYTDPVAPDYLEPRYYTVTGGVSLIHSSHVIRCEGEPLPRRMKALNQGWGDSVLRKALEDLKDVVASKGGIAGLIQEANVDVVTREGLSDELASGEEDKIVKRYALAAQMKSLINQLLLDGTETYERKAASFGGLGEILDKLMIWISGAADIPMTRFFGQSAAGMDATGEGDMKNYYDSVSADQESTFRPELTKLDNVLIRSAVGDMPEECSFEWNPLYQESGTELAQQDLARAQSEDIRLNSGVLQRHHVMERLRQEGRYGITDEEVEAERKAAEQEAAGMFDPPPEPMADPDEGETGE